MKKGAKVHAEKMPTDLEACLAMWTSEHRLAKWVR